jgi:archaellum component FlaC
MIVKTDNEKFVRDSTTNTIINTDVESYKQYKMMRDTAKQISLMQKKIESLEAQIKRLTEKIEQNG